MQRQRNFKYVSFIQKLAIINYFYNEVHLSFEEIAIIVNSRSEIVQLYCKRLLH